MTAIARKIPERLLVRRAMHARRARGRGVLLSGGLVLLTGIVGCTLGPEPRRPDPGLELQTPFHAAAEGEAAKPPAEQAQSGWWRRFDDPATNQLVAEALSENTDLRIAAARIAESRQFVVQARAARLPSLSAGFARDRRRQSLELPGGIGAPGNGPAEATDSVRVGFHSTTYDLGLDVAWQADLFGRLRRAEQAARFELAANAIDREALEQTIVAEVVRSRVALGTLRRQLELAEANLESLRQTRDVVEARYRQGLAAALEVRLAREGVASAEAALPALEAQVRLREHALAVLLGRRPGPLDLPDGLPPVPEVDPPPVGLPVGLLDNRPDLRAAELRAMASQARIGAAVADLFPQLTLSAGAGFVSSDLSDLLRSDAAVYNLLAGVTQPLFEGGRRRAEVRATRARAEAAAAQYAGQILTALREVEDALVREESSRREAAAAGRALEEARLAESMARERYRQGLEPLLSVFEAERRRQAAEERLTLARQGIWNARIDLHLALGGDWGAEASGVGPTTAAMSASCATSGVTEAGGTD